MQSILVVGYVRSKCKLTLLNFSKFIK